MVIKRGTKGNRGNEKWTNDYRMKWPKWYFSIDTIVSSMGRNPLSQYVCPTDHGKRTFQRLDADY